MTSIGSATTATASTVFLRRNAHRHTVKRVALMAVGAVAAALFTSIAIVLLDANILRQPIANYIGQKLERPFSINGDLRIGLSNHPHVEVEGIVLGNAPWSTQSKMVQIERARISIAVLPLLGGHIVLPEVELTGPDVVLERDIDGEANWNFGSDPGAQSKPPTHPPEIRSLRIDRGKLVFRDPQSKTEIELAVNSDRGAEGSEANVRFVGQGILRNDAFHLEGRAGSLLELTASGKPYRLDVTATAGQTKASFTGTFRSSWKPSMAMST